MTLIDERFQTARSRISDQISDQISDLETLLREEPIKPPITLPSESAPKSESFSENAVEKPSALAAHLDACSTCQQNICAHLLGRQDRIKPSFLNFCQGVEFLLAVKEKRLEPITGGERIELAVNYARGSIYRLWLQIDLKQKAR